MSTFILGAFDETFYIIDLEHAITFINWEVIFLVMGMMIVVGIIENTGIFQWLAFQAYRASRGRISWLIVVLVIITSIASALLDNVTTMLLMVPISMQIALALGISPLVLLIPEILASLCDGNRRNPCAYTRSTTPVRADMMKRLCTPFRARFLQNTVQKNHPRLSG